MNTAAQSFAQNVATRFAVTDLAPVATTTNLPAIAADVGVVRQQIVDSSLELQRQATELAFVKRGTWATVQGSMLQRAKALVIRSDLLSFNDSVPGTLFGGAAGGGAVGALVGWATTSHPLGWAVGIAVATVVASLVPAAVMVRNLAHNEERKARGSMVEVAQLEGPLQRFRDASAASKVQIATGLQTIYATLFEEKVASPEALAALKSAIAEGESLATSHGERIQNFSVLGTYVNAEIDSAAVLQIESVLNAFVPEERRVVAEALRQTFFADRARVAAMPFEVRNKLHTLLVASPEKPAE